MAAPRFTGLGFTNPTNPLALHSESRHRELTPMGHDFQAETLVFNALGAALIKMIAEFAEEAGEKAFQKAIREGLTNAEAKTAKEGTIRAVKEAMEEAAEKALKEGSEESAEKAAKKAGKEAAEKEATEEAVEQTAKEAAQEGSEKLGKAGFLGTTATGGLGAVIGVGVFAVAGAMGLKGVTKGMEDFAGLNCGEKANDAGLESGTDKYTGYVKECQEAAAKRMMALGITGIVVVGGIAFLLLK